jgi:hypothetical protein
MARLSMFFALVIFVFNVVMLDLPLLVLLANFLCMGTLLHAGHQLFSAEAWRMKVKTMADTSATDLEKAMALLEDARTSTDERPAP